MLHVGLTGGVGSGKSTVATMLATHGAGVVDADALSHQLTQPGGAAIEPLRSIFGPNMIANDGSLDRSRMRACVFSDVTARKQLEALLHPLIRSAMRERAALLASSNCPYIVFVVPLLVESGRWRDYADRVLVVDCSEATQIARVSGRSSIGETTARAIVAAQATRAQRLAIADDVLVNEARVSEIELKVKHLHTTYLQSSNVRESRETL